MKVALIAVSLAAVAAAAPQDNDGARRRRARTPQPEEVIRGIHGEVLGPASTPDTTLGGQFFNPLPPPTGKEPLPQNVFEITIKNTGTGWEEPFLVGIPKNPLFPAPVLVVFHAYAEDPRKVLDRTTYFAEGMDRGWIVVAPMSAHQFNFGIDYAHVNTEKALDWVGKWLAVDPDRFYAVGFSLGGGMASSYVARHIDPKHARFAALVNHTGSTSILDVYNRSANAGLLEGPLMFGGPPATFPFEYSIASVIDYDWVTATVDPLTDLARNLSHIDTKNFHAQGDINTYLIEQTQETHAQILFRGGSSVYETSGHNPHKWWTLNETQTLNWLQQFSFKEPMSGTVNRTLADRDARYFHFDITQRAAGAFSPFRWSVDEEDNLLYLDELENVDHVTIDAAAARMSTVTPLEIAFANNDGGTVEIEVLGYPVAPTTVLRNGQASGSWTHDPENESVVLTEVDGAEFPTWRIEP